MDNQLMDLAAFKRLEKMPTKIELIATIARLLNQVYILPALHAFSAVHCIDTTVAVCKSVATWTFWSALVVQGCAVRYRCQPRLRSASNRSQPRLYMVSRLLLTVMTTRMLLYLTSSPSPPQSSRRNFACLHSLWFTATLIPPELAVVLAANSYVGGLCDHPS